MLFLKLTKNYCAKMSIHAHNLSSSLSIKLFIIWALIIISLLVFSDQSYHYIVFLLAIFSIRFY